MTQEEYIEIKKGYIKFVTKHLTNNGNLGPSISVLGTQKETGENTVVHVLIASEFMKSDKSKDEFVDNVLPQIAKEIAKDYTITAVAWAAEAWLRVVEKDKATTEQLKDWKKLPVQKEVLIVSIDCSNGSDVFVQEIVRKGKQVNKDGELVDHVELLELPEYTSKLSGVSISEGGRFANLYKKFTENI